MQTERITSCYRNICFNSPIIHTAPWTSRSPRFLLQGGFLKMKNRVCSPQNLELLKEHWHLSFFFFFAIFVCFWQCCQKNMTVKKKKKKKKSLMFYWICLPFKFVWLHLMFPVAFLFVLMHQSTPLFPRKKNSLLQIWLPVSPSDFQRLQSMKQRLWTWARFFILWSSPLASLCFSKPLRFFYVVSFSFPGGVADRRATGN